MARGTEFEELKRRAEALIADGHPGISVGGNSNRGPEFRLSDALDAVCRETGLAGWTHLHFEQAAEAAGRQERANRLKVALFFGQHWVVRRLLALDPDLANDNFGLEVALYDEAAVSRRLTADRECATRAIGPRTPILHLAFSQHLHSAPELEPQMLRIADALVRCGADVNDGFPAEPGSPTRFPHSTGQSATPATFRWPGGCLKTAPTRTTTNRSIIQPKSETPKEQGFCCVSVRRSRGRTRCSVPSTSTIMKRLECFWPKVRT